MRNQVCAFEVCVLQVANVCGAEPAVSKAGEGCEESGVCTPACQGAC